MLSGLRRAPLIVYGSRTDWDVLGLSRIWKEERTGGLPDVWGKWKMSYL